MTDDTETPRREIMLRRTLVLGTLAAVAGAPVAAATLTPLDGKAPVRVRLATGEGQGAGEGEGSPIDPGTALMRDLGFMQGHLRAGIALYEVGDIGAARAHMGHPIEEKYDAVAAALAERGLERLKGEIAALAAATENAAPMVEIAALHDRVAATIATARAGATVAQRAAGLIALARVAGEEYTDATEGGTLSNLHEYQDAWGFLKVVRDEVTALGNTGDETVAKTAEKMLAALAATDAVVGDIQGGGDFAMDAGVIFGAAARMELAAGRLK